MSENRLTGKAMRKPVPKNEIQMTEPMDEKKTGPEEFLTAEQ